MSRHWRIFIPTTIGVILIVGLAVAQDAFSSNPSNIVFPGPTTSRNEKSESTPASKHENSELSKTLQLAKKISSFDSIDEFLSITQGFQLRTGFTFGNPIEETEERSNAEKAIPAKCMPELQPVSLNLESDPSTMYFPSCTRIKRCGGCCSHSLLSCQPIASEFRNFEVAVMSVTNTDGFSYRGKRIVPLEEHTKCVCDCRIKAEHCTEKQSYVKDECRCRCNNIDEEDKCRKNNETKIWNPELCTCLCRDEQECSTGFYFDQNACRCRQVPLSKTWIQLTKDAADPRRKPKEDPEYK
ncbi:PDGF- and VEGF-related factor 1 isoform X2 [Calliopsis andreniformis]|uniref:PDGF- and VEGF-related factor 1 isoform X2 n=1 Tax=Calliopsis andreniformis TaxID=337506 RepID=UPI003FCEB181